MRSLIVAAAIVALAAATAGAQPGMTPQGGPPPPGMAPPPQPGMMPPPGMVPPPYAYQPPTPEEQELLASGYIGDGTMIGGGVLALWLGFGVGQGVEGRWHDTGWIFTLGESAALVGVIAGAIGTVNNCDFNGQCSNNNGSVTLLVGSALALGGLRIWEVVDAFIGPGEHNEQVRALRRRYGYRDYARVAPYVSRPQASDGGGTAGLSFRF